MTATLTTIRAELAAAACYPTQEARLIRAIVAAIDAYLTFKQLQRIREHVARVNGREGGYARLRSQP